MQRYIISPMRHSRVAQVGTAVSLGILETRVFQKKTSFPPVWYLCTYVSSGMHSCACTHMSFGFPADKMQSTDSHSAEEVGEVENNPVSKAIARHLGIDISAEGRLAKNRKGIAIIIHGTPLSGM